MYSLRARSFSIAGIWSHNFWVLCDSTGTVLAELHGLATDRTTGRPVPIGYARRHSLRAWCFEQGCGITLCKPAQRSALAFEADEVEVRERWRVATDAIEHLNALDLDYPIGGIRLLGKTFNSNSLFTTFAGLLSVPLPRFPGVLQPGLGNCVMQAVPFPLEK